MESAPLSTMGDQFDKAKGEKSEAPKLHRVAAVVVTYNRKALLRQCLEALQSQTHPVAETIVIDNASSDGTTAMLEQEFPKVMVHRLELNRGGAGGFREGIRRAAERDVDWIWVMDDDAEPLPDALEELVHFSCSKGEKVAALASRKVGPEGKDQISHIGKYNPVRMSKTKLTWTENEGAIDYSSFVGLAIRRNATKEVGLPEEGFFIWGDDVEYALRLRTYGTLKYVPDSVVVHHDAFASKRKQARLGSKAWRTRPINQYWRKYYELRNPLLILNRYVQSVQGRVLGYVVALWRALLAVMAVLILDTRKFPRLFLIGAALHHGVRGLSGHYVRPEHFPERLHPENLHQLLPRGKSARNK